MRGAKGLVVCCHAHPNFSTRFGIKPAGALLWGMLSGMQYLLEAQYRSLNDHQYKFKVFLRWTVHACSITV